MPGLGVITDSSVVTAPASCPALTVGRLRGAASVDAGSDTVILTHHYTQLTLTNIITLPTNYLIIYLTIYTLILNLIQE